MGEVADRTLVKLLTGVGTSRQ